MFGLLRELENFAFGKSCVHYFFYSGSTNSLRPAMASTDERADRKNDMPAETSQCSRSTDSENSESTDEESRSESYYASDEGSAGTEAGPDYLEATEPRQVYYY